MARMMADCRRFESDSNCTLTIIGDADEVLAAAAEHAASVHGPRTPPSCASSSAGCSSPAEAYSESRTAELIPV